MNVGKALKFNKLSNQFSKHIKSKQRPKYYSFSKKSNKFKNQRPLIFSVTLMTLVPKMKRKEKKRIMNYIIAKMILLYLYN